MKRKFFLMLVSLLVIVSIAACSTTTASAGAGLATRTLSAAGEGDVYVVPDVAYIYVGVQTNADDVATALSENNTQANAVAKAVTDLGVEAKDVQTTSFNVSPMQDYAPDGTVSRKYYQVQNTVYITVRDLTKLGKLLDAVVQSGANTINGINFDIQDKDTVMAKARDLAIQKAINEAKAIASASGVKLGNLQSISVYTNNVTTPMFDAKGGNMSAASNVPVSAGQLEITATSNLVYEIK